MGFALRSFATLELDFRDALSLVRVRLHILFPLGTTARQSIPCSCIHLDRIDISACADLYCRLLHEPQLRPHDRSSKVQDKIHLHVHAVVLGRTLLLVVVERESVRLLVEHVALELLIDAGGSPVHVMVHPGV